MNSFLKYLTDARGPIDNALDALVPSPETRPQRIHEAMRYSLFAGGKRIRPALVLLAGESLGAQREDLLPGAAAVEMVHTFSLVHDDLPGLDNDDLRRGRPTVHRQYDEATAILVGDALLNLGLIILASEPSHIPAERRNRAMAMVGGAIGTLGMIGGQVEDLAATESWPENASAALKRIHQGKTGALLSASLRLGGIYAGADSAVDQLLSELGHAIGLLFQIRDDILDVEGTSETLGKTAGKDAAQRKLTYPGLHGLEESKRLLDATRQNARRLANDLGDPEGLLEALIEYLATRDR